MQATWQKLFLSLRPVECMNEWSRQLVHLSGVLFVVLGQFLPGRATAAVFFLIALTFLLYSIYIRREANRFQRYLHLLDKKVRPTLLKFERQGVPFQGAFWFYVGCGLAFLLFPLGVATVACLILAISDSLSTLLGHHLGKRRWRGKSIVGTGAFFISAWAIAWFFLPSQALLAAAAGVLGELLPALVPGLQQRGWVDDNLLIPLFVGAALLI